MKEKIYNAAEANTLKIFGELSDFTDVTEGFINGAEWMLEQVLDFMRDFKNGQGEFPLYDYIGNVRKAMEE